MIWGQHLIPGVALNPQVWAGWGLTSFVWQGTETGKGEMSGVDDVNLGPDHLRGVFQPK